MEPKRRILEAAKQCFARYGYNKTSIRDICETAKANLAMVNYYYGSKEALYYKVMQDLREEIGYAFERGPAFEDEPRQIPEPAEALKDFIHLFLTFRNENPLLHTLLKNDLSSDIIPKEVLGEILSPCLEQLRTILIAGKEQKVFHYDTLTQASRFIAALLVYPAYDVLLFEEPQGSQTEAEVEREDEIRQTVHFVLAGLSCRA